MELILTRFAFGVNATIGVLVAGTAPVCFTLEDADRDMASLPKLKGRTAIPAGTYDVRISWSPKFKRELPEILGVPEFSFIRIHWGNRPEDSDGCVLLGETADVKRWLVLDSRKAFAAAYPILQKASSIQIVRAGSAWGAVEQLRGMWLKDYVSGEVVA